MTDSERPGLERPRITFLQSLVLWVLGLTCMVTALILWIKGSGGDAVEWLTFAAISIFAVGTFSKIA